MTRKRDPVMVPLRHPRKRLDASLIDVARAAVACLRTARSAGGATARLADLWKPRQAVIACLSARSGLDLLLSCVSWPPGSEVVVSAVTIPHIPRLIREHGYVPVAVDLDPATMEATAEAVDAACTPRTRAVLVAHLFGATADTTTLAELARRRGVTLIEDRAQCYDGANRALGRADVAVYSFGTIKTATCFGGGVLLVADPALHARMRDRQRSYPVQPTIAYLRRLATVAALLIISRPRWYPLVTAAADRLTGDYDRVVRSASRGFTDADLLRQLRHRPSTALLATMATRLSRYDPIRVRGRRAAGNRLSEALDEEVRQLGAGATGRTHWLLALTSYDPAALVRAGRAAGFDLTTGSSTLIAVDRSCSRVDEAMRDVVYLPVDPTMSDTAATTLADIVNTVERRAAGQHRR